MVLPPLRGVATRRPASFEAAGTGPEGRPKERGPARKRGLVAELVGKPSCGGLSLAGRRSRHQVCPAGIAPA